MGTQRQYLTLKAFCEELAVAKSTFYDWCAKGRAPRHFKLPNGEIRIRRTDLESWLESREVAA
ncbi:helix-turn-helix transcriptional regulator [Prauserella endophytica]|uniref:Helix-turn-helix domain-containing protein n=1 Tax=Prauserella endophytica TaxID=1592324 RepID=A0ABY2S0A1_9PSEU|nr:helix-turn-helix domain-containing protein [Prauserella endophytica]TKG67517.1 helix-turn-helix domain-containing protein [Prauserella endophytica]